MLPAGHTPVIPPLPAELQSRLIKQISDLRRLLIDLQHAQSSGLPVSQSIAEAERGLQQLETIHGAYFPAGFARD